MTGNLESYKEFGIRHFIIAEKRMAEMPQMRYVALRSQAAMSLLSTHVSLEMVKRMCRQPNQSIRTDYELLVL